MNAMRNFFGIGTAAMMAASFLLGGCSAALNSAASVNDGMYASHDRVQIANRQREAAEVRKAEAEARRAELEARIAEAQVRMIEEGDYYYDDGYNGYASVLADTYESAYARRLRGFSSPTYRMPSSYYDLRYGGSFNYVTAYDPAFYNIMVSGSEVWVEPKYISSMFGSWGAANVTIGFGFYPYNWYYGWNMPYYYGSWWGYPHYSWYDWNWAYGYNPYYPYWGFNHFGWHYGGGSAWAYHHPHRPAYTHAPRPRPQRPDIVNRPSASAPSAGSGNASRQARGTVSGSGAYRPASGSNRNTGSGSTGTSSTTNRNRPSGSGSAGSDTRRSGSSGFSSSGTSRSGGSSYSSGSRSGGGHSSGGHSSGGGHSSSGGGGNASRR